MKPRLQDLPWSVRRVVPAVLDALRNSYKTWPHYLTSRDISVISTHNLALSDEALKYLVAIGEVETSIADYYGHSVEVFRPRQPKPE
jgi:hypothetical protein